MNDPDDTPPELTQADLNCIVEEGRETHFRKYLAETDAAMAAALAEKYQGLVPASRIDNLLGLPTQFQEREVSSTVADGEVLAVGYDLGVLKTHDVNRRLGIEQL